MQNLCLEFDSDILKDISMGLFHYSASSADGTIVRGDLSANDKHELAALLAQQNLFLVSCTEDAPVETAPPVAESTPQAAAPETKEIVQRKRIILAVCFVGAV